MADELSLYCGCYIPPLSHSLRCPYCYLGNIMIMNNHIDTYNAYCWIWKKKIILAQMLINETYLPKKIAAEKFPFSYKTGLGYFELQIIRGQIQNKS